MAARRASGSSQRRSAAGEPRDRTLPGVRLSVSQSVAAVGGQMGGIYSVPICPLPNLFSKHPNSAPNAIRCTHQLGVIAIIRSGRVPCPSAAATSRRGSATVPSGVRTAVPR